MRFTFLLCTCLLTTACTETELFEQAPIHCVDPFVGTGGHGHTYPGAALPFGMVQLSPDTRLDGWDGCSGYHFSDDVIYGFSHTHLSGTGVSDYGDILFMPARGEVNFNNGHESGPDDGYGSRFRKSKENATPGFYTVYLEDPEIEVELTASLRAGVQRYTSAHGNFHVIVDLEHRDELLDHGLNLSSDGELTGFRISRSWAKRQHVYFATQFSRPVKRIEYFPPENPTKAALHFESAYELTIKTGISAVSAKNAKANREAEVFGHDFTEVHKRARKQWIEQLGKIEVTGGKPGARKVFYTALYHTMLAPNIFNDINGEYRGIDGKVHRADHNVYTVFSLWDTFRALHPLFHIIERERTEDFLKTFLLHFEQGGRLPVWELAGNETDCMIGYHSIPVIADAYAKGIRGFDTERMLKAMISAAEEDHFGLAAYRKYGFIPASEEPESVSKTLEYAYDDACIAAFAAMIGDSAVHREYSERAQHYRNLFDPKTKFFRARMNGGWFSPFDPAEVNFNYTEANAWQYSAFVPHDIEGLAKLHGGYEALEEHLDRMFSASSKMAGREQADITGLIGQYAHGNEPSHHMAYLYNYTGSPWKTQEMVARIADELYSTDPDGLSGNEDCGQMSAWYVLSAMGFYPVNPGSDEYAIGTPLFDQTIIRLENGKTFTITASNGVKTGPYIRSATLNEGNYPNSYIRHGDIAAGGSLIFKHSRKPRKDWGSAPEHQPHTSLQGPRMAAVPFFRNAPATFTDSIDIEIGSIDADAELFYAIDGGKDTAYSAPVRLRETCTLGAYAVLPKGGQKSKVVESTFHRVDGKRSIELGSTYAPAYSAGGDNALIDRQRGGKNFRTGRWQGFEGQDLIAMVDLGELSTPEKIGIGFLQDIKSWIWMPKRVRFEISADGETWKHTGTVKTTVPRKREGAVIKEFEVVNADELRYVRIMAANAGPCPEWHPGSGGKSWLFADEIYVE
ncbi:MAG: GH92 family glycosyl hydrolase [Cryomorphaceae bacterium]